MNAQAFDVDLVVAGAGGAGLTAALVAAKAGRSVAVLEWREQFRHGNNTSMSTAMIPAAGSRWQQAAQIPDSAETFLADIAKKTHGEADSTIAAALVGVGPALVEWLADDCGLPLELVTDFTYPGHSYPRCHSLPDRAGRSMLKYLLDALAAQPTATLLVGTRLAEVRLGDDGRVRSVIAADAAGNQEEISTGSVVLATGGFGADEELVREFIPEIAEGMYFGGDGCVGDALRISRGMGADIGYLDAYQGHGSVATPHGVLTTWATVMHGAVIVNTDGRRFGDETIGYSEYARMVLDQPGETAVLIFDERIDAQCRPFKDYQDLVAQGGVQWSDNPDQLGSTAGIDAATLEKTLAEAGLSAAGAPDVWGRSNWEGPLSGRLAWVRITGALFHTQGGVLVDGDARVLKDGAPIPGLYAAGGAAAGISGHGPAGYLAGNGLIAALGLGYLAGRAVLAD